MSGQKSRVCRRDGNAGIMIVFFFSSRRRHTSYIGDWSSDVCSSDLGVMVTTTSDGWAARTAATSIGVSTTRRSEERRVGKECSTRGAPEPYKKNAAGRRIAAAVGRTIDGVLAEHAITATHTTDERSK